MISRKSPQPALPERVQPSYDQLTDEQRGSLRRCIHEKLCNTRAGLTTVGVLHCVSCLDRYLKFRPTLSNVVDALCAMTESGAVHRHDGDEITIWTAIRRPAQSSLPR